MKLWISRKKSILKRLYPSMFTPSAYELDYETLYEQGYRGIIFDIDNTLVGHDAPANEEAVNLARKLKNMGFKLSIVSNNREPRVKSFADALGVSYVFKAAKPRTGGYIKAMEIMGTSLKTTLAIGDQLLTDIYGANRTGIFSIKVEQLYREEPGNIVFKRYIERLILFFYMHEKE